jgi:hypothetical protein
MFVTVEPKTKLRHLTTHLWCIMYYGNFYGCGLKKIIFIKSTFSWGWFDIYICLVKTVIKIEVEQKIV